MGPARIHSLKVVRGLVGVDLRGVPLSLKDLLHDAKLDVDARDDHHDRVDESREVVYQRNTDALEATAWKSFRTRAQNFANLFTPIHMLIRARKPS